MRIACVQTNVTFGNPDANASAAVDKLHFLKGEGVDLAVFPEAYLTGYCAGSQEEAESIALDLSGWSHPALSKILAACVDLDMGCVVGYAGKVAGKLLNGATLFEPGVSPRQYLKTHLPFLGYDRFASPGHELPVFETRWGRIGILICFDLRPPEAARTLALKGADLIVLPTNWPVGAEVSADHVAIARAAENRVFMATCNRVGTENGTTFIGRSKIIGLGGQVIEAAGDQEEDLIADLDLPLARNKRIVNIPGEYEMEVFSCRQPELYKSIYTTNM
jgi:predicted amidohydrolase